MVEQRLIRERLQEARCDAINGMLKEWGAPGRRGRRFGLPGQCQRRRFVPFRAHSYV